MKKPTKMILTAGPKIGKHDVRYVADAVKHGWNFRHGEYIRLFEEKFAKYVGVKFAMTVPSGTSALHLSLVLMGIGKGDEVIVPDLTYISCATAVHYAGAKPVLAEVDRATWSIDTTKLERYITKKTKAIMPVHLYGNVADVDGIRKIAKKHRLFIVEDACQGLGCTLQGKMIGNLGDAAGFSFQGAKLLALGEGGMFVTNHTEWIKRAQSLIYQGISQTRQFWHNEIGFTYFMSDIQAALGVARLEEMRDLVARKRRIFSWYKERLGDVRGLGLNPERPGVVSSYWMSSIVLEKDFGITRDELRRKLKKQMIDTRPFFYPISDFHLFGKQTINPVAHDISYNGINLPSGVMLTEHQVDYISTTVKKLLGV